MKKILGFSAHAHDSAAALLIGDQVVAAAEEERFNRQKHSGVFPVQAIDYCLQSAGITAADLDIIAYYLDASPEFFPALRQFIEMMVFFTSRHGFLFRDIFEQLLTEPAKVLNYFQQTSGFVGSLFGWGKELRLQLRLDRQPKPVLIGIPHHFAHIGSSYLVSGFERAGILIADQRGERHSTTLAVGRGQEVQILNTIEIPHSLGSLYAALTEYLGFHAFGGEGKVMGLSSYGQPAYMEKFQRYLPLQPDGTFKLNTRYIDFSLAAFTGYFPKRLIAELGPVRIPDQVLEQRHKDIARSLQLQLEEALLALCQSLDGAEEIDRLCLTGGIALNSAANGRIAEELPQIKEIYVPSAPGDAGAALGAAVWAACLNGSAAKIQPHAPYLGPEYNEITCRVALERSGCSYQVLQDPCETAARVLSQGKVIGWFQGRMEFGPRALGNRSILAHPGSVEMRDRVNKIKGREPWRPLAPSVLEEYANVYFYPPCHSPYMSFVARVRPEAADQIAACVHVDGTARLQTVTFDDNPVYWKLIKEFEGYTGIPVVMNTSFNTWKEPIVCTPGEAIASFIGMGLDYLFLGNMIVARHPDQLEVSLL